MTEERVEVLVLMDEERNYYLIPCQTLEQARVSVDQAAAIDTALAGDTTGFHVLLGADRWLNQRYRAILGRPDAGLPGTLFAPVGMISIPPPSGGGRRE